MNDYKLAVSDPWEEPPEDQGLADEMGNGDERFGEGPEAALTPETIDSLRHYLQEIGRVPLLSAAEEVALAEQIERGQAAADELASDQPIDHVTRRALEGEVARGDEARRRLIQANLRLVVSVARRYKGRGMAMLDLVQEGNLGLMRAVEKFDYHRGLRFSTYATWWIRQAIVRGLAQQSREIRLPVHMGESLSKLRNATEQLTQRLQRRPNPAELAEHLGLTVAQVKHLLTAEQHTLSLETPIGEPGSQTLGELVPNHQAPGLDDVAAGQLLRRDLSAALALLSERERRVLDMRFGLVDGRTYTLEEIGRILGITRERVRQLEALALERLRELQAGQQLRDYLA